ncbi:MAG: hypothetical protein ACU0AY_07335 [Marinibacterium profundimaris]|uniref:DUF1127 domain-containing protein n=1 Tax=Marinibacterium profundimaris TaxID=1679460 RepID=A0A225NHJ3_9RHOB|nr:hypothetical protein ATO3_14580 [Marinibacterium profundimaris]
MNAPTRPARLRSLAAAVLDTALRRRRRARQRTYLLGMTPHLARDIGAPARLSDRRRADPATDGCSWRLRRHPLVPRRRW